MEIRLRAPGSTSNLGPGFDTLGMALTVYNRITIRTTNDQRLHLKITGEGADQLLQDENNLFFQSAKSAAERAGKSLPGMEVDMHNSVPLARGLGSSSTAIVAGITAANLLCGEPFSQTELLNLATELESHPDNVSACLLGGLTVSSFSDGHVECIRVLPPPGLKTVVVVPRFELQTSAARAALPKEVSHKDATFNVSRACLVTAALLSGNFQALRAGMQDRLHQPYRAPLVPGFHQVLNAAQQAGALGACLSGAGPTLLAFTEQHAETVQAAMLAAWKQEGIEADAHVLEIDSDGVTVE
ncbi:MAG: homoserine kinase [bacterium]|nr:homoserine kinase [bacterium]